MLLILPQIIGTIKYLTGGNSNLRLKQKTIKFTDQVNNPDGNNDNMVTKHELEVFLNKNLRPEKNKENGKIIKRILRSMFNSSTPSLDTDTILQMLRKGIEFEEPYNENSIFMKNTKSKMLFKIQYCDSL